MFVRRGAVDMELLEVLLCLSVSRFYNSFQKMGKLYSLCSKLFFYSSNCSRVGIFGWVGTTIAPKCLLYLNSLLSPSPQQLFSLCFLSVIVLLTLLPDSFFCQDAGLPYAFEQPVYQPLFSCQPSLYPVWSLEQVASAGP